MYDKFEKREPYALLDTSKYPPEVAGRFNSFITTQFDDSLSVEMQMRSIIKWAIDNFKEMDQTYNDFTEYIVQGNLNPFIQFLNDLIEYMNEFVDTFDTRFQDEILLNLQKWNDDGTLTTLINESLDTKYHEMVNRLTTQLIEIDDKKINRDRGEVTSADLSQEVKEQLSGGSVAVVGTNAVNTVNIVDKAVTLDKLADEVNLKGYPFEKNVTPSSDVRKAVLDVKIYNGNPNKRYVLSMLRKNFSNESGTITNSYHILINEVNGTPYGDVVSSFQKSDYNAPVGIDKVRTTGTVTADVFIDWHKLPDGTNTGSVTHANGGLHPLTYIDKIDVADVRTRLNEWDSVLTTEDKEWII